VLRERDRAPECEEQLHAGTGSGLGEFFCRASINEKVNLFLFTPLCSSLELF
jgi:hypothetical protein